MIKAVGAKASGSTVVFLGLSRRNTELLLEDKPMVIDLHQLDPRLPEVEIVLFAGETEEELASQLGRAQRGEPDG